MDRLVVLVPAWNSQYFPAPNSLLNLLTKLIITTERYRTIAPSFLEPFPDCYCCPLRGTIASVGDP
jgi:hypothetical protein